MNKHIPLSKRLKQYATTGAAFLLAAPTIQAAVIFTDLDPDVTYDHGDGLIPINLNNSGNEELNLGFEITNYSSLTTAAFVGVANNQSATAGIGYYLVAYGDPIGPGFSFTNSQLFNVRTSSYGSPFSSSGPVSPGDDGYIPVRFSIGGNTHYGYVHIEFTGETYILKDYAYESTPDTRIGAGAMPTLPVELSLFKAQAQEDYIHLAWQTETEIENAGFEIQRATENFEWETLAWEEGQGTTTQQQKYAYDDRDLRMGVQYYYRLKQIGTDEDFTYSDIVSATLRVDQLELGPVTPNPTVNGQASVDIFSPKSNKATISIFSNDGKLVSQENIEINDSRILHELDLQGLSTGIYFLKVVTDKESAYQKIVVK